MVKKKDLEKVIEHLETHSRKLERMEKQTLKNTKKLERLEIVVASVGVFLAFLQILLTLYFR